MAKPTAETPVPLLTARGISKSYPGVQALEDVALNLYPGSVTALIGENGAGKSTLVRTMTGVEQLDAGSYALHGTELKLTSPTDAQNYGIVAIHQEPTMFDDLTVVENFFIDGLLQNPRSRLLDWVEMRRQAKTHLMAMNIEVDVNAPVSELSLAQRHLMSVAKALSRNAQVLILDEPTAALSRQEIDELFVIVNRLKSEGKAILFISHKFDEIFEIADQYVVLRDGRFIAEGVIAETTIEKLIELMVGRSLAKVFSKVPATIGTPILSIEGLGSEGEFADVSFNLQKSEILGFYGLVGAGRSEVMRAIFGMRDDLSGRIRLHGNDYVPKDPAHAIDNGIYYLSEDRQKDCVFLSLPILNNLCLPIIDTLRKGSSVSPQAELEIARRYGADLQVKASSWGQEVGQLSGGNQQKVAIGMGLVTKPEILILDEPTRGVDVGSKSAVHDLVGNLVQSGLSVIMVSSELEEILGVSDRIVVMHRGRIRKIYNRDEATREDILAEAAAT